MRKFLLALLVAVWAVGGWAAGPVATLRFDKMQLSADGGKSFGEPFAVSGSFELGAPLVVFTVGKDQQSYDLHQTTQNDDRAWVYRCTTKENQAITITYNPDAKTIDVGTEAGVSRFWICSTVQ